MQYSEQQKEVLKRWLEDGKYKSVIKPILQEIFYNSIGVCVPADKIIGRKDFIDMFDEIIKE